MLNRLFSLIGKSIAPSGKGVVSAVFSRGTAPSFPEYGTYLYEETLYQSINVEGQMTIAGTFLRLFYANGLGGSYYEDSAVSWYSYGTVLTTINTSTDVTLCGGTYNLASFTSDYASDGSGGYYFTSGYSSYTSYGTYLTNCDGYNYYADGSGSYYSESASSNPSYGTYLDGSSSNLEVYFSNTWFSGYLVIGTSNYSVYADGNGGTYSESGNSYYSYGTQIGSYYDNDSYTQYYIYSDGMGGYYTFN